MRFIGSGTRVSAILVAALLCACGGNGNSSAPPGLPNGIHRASSSGQIQHVVVLIQENRSFNNLFLGYPGATTQSYGYDSLGEQVTLNPVPLEAKWDLEHDSTAFFRSCDGTGKIPGTNCQMNGFNREWLTCTKSESNPCPWKYSMYAYVPSSETKPYFDIAGQYVLADQMYASNFDESSFISHQYIISAQAESAVNYPLVLPWGCPGGPSDTITTLSLKRKLVLKDKKVVCWDPTTLGDEMDSAGISWAFYSSTIGTNSGEWNGYQAINHIYNGPDWNKDIFTSQNQFFTDVGNGNLRAVSWITPSFENSDHPASGYNTGPSWVASVINAIGESQYWNSTAIFVFWDDSGGWYDPEPPPYADYDGLGMRIPMLIVSAYAKQGYVSHVQYEHGSILKFIEQNFGLAPLSASDARANSPTDAFDFSAPPRQFTPIEGSYSLNYFLHQPPSRHPLDTN
ncbi:MAG: hypothetical protein JO113_01610 [Candidatus Eremiobacteraeota bacterium]|nr:hypothetical protein [Candidatus Eremiobacteraeota bacterium]